jgi:hypothetical protein
MWPSRELAALSLVGALTVLALGSLPVAAAADQRGQQAPPPTTRPSVALAPVDYAAVIVALDSPDPEARRVAGLRLNSFGGAALPLVERALADPDVSPESSIRLRRALPPLRARARRERREQAREAYVAAQWEAAYRQAGSTDPAVDADALHALRLWWTAHRPPDPAQRRATLEAFGRAAEKGCRNELFWIGFRNVAGVDQHLVPTVPGAPYGNLMRYVGGDGPPLVRLTICTRRLMLDQYENERIATAAADAVTALAKDPAAPVGLVDDLAMAHYAWYGGANDPRFSKPPQGFLKAYAAGAQGRPGYHLFSGNRLIDSAWEARGGGWANTVTPEGWRLFGERLEAARRELEEAWRLDPDDPRPGARLIVVHMGLSTGRNAMETWFRRAVAADPDDWTAYNNKLYYLEPKWHGSHDEMIAFGRECLDTQNWRAGIPFMLVDAHETVARQDGGPGVDAKAYYADPAVWRDVRAVFDGHLVNAPDDVRRRSQFARYATLAERWPEADAQFRILGDNADYAPFGGKGTYDYLRRKAARLAKAPPAEPTPAPR